MAFWLSGESAAVVLRFFLYLDLLLLAGVLACHGKTAPAAAGRGVMILMTLAGLVLTVLNAGAMAMAMTGGDVAMLDRDMAGFIAFETSAGRAALARLALIGALFAAILALPALAKWHAALALAALGTLAWTGHAGASEGWIGTLHRFADVIHLAAAAVWLGTLALLVTALSRPSIDCPELAGALRRFSVIGTIVVGALAVSGAVNLVAIVGWSGLADLPSSQYGRVLFLKLAMFAAMLGFAALNRWRLTPRLERADISALGSVRASVIGETVIGVGIILVVALLGTLSPIE